MADHMGFSIMLEAISGVTYRREKGLQLALFGPHP